MEPQFSAPVEAPIQPKNNTLALASLIIGILGLLLVCLGVVTAGFGVGIICACFGFLAGIAALVTGFMARNQIKASGEKGAGMALAGMIMGGIQVVLLLCSVCVITVLTIMGPVVNNVFMSINQSLK